ncbi:kelch motif domain-containing protein [Cyclospora cayetanensis]|uniref:Kelch motif domain-containing protein n=1 Tax=Cyclospora cayetanensis TaxID=88456 RepID=A0A1D3D997_9EIME|nr:kelch motif domain-containing protein [Cyclospora cayetanensis]
MSKIDETLTSEAISGSFSADSQEDMPKMADEEAVASEEPSSRRSGSRMQRAKQQLKIGKERIIHSLSGSKKTKAHPRRVEGDEEDSADRTGPNTAFFSPPSFQLTQIIHDSHCFIPRQGHCCVAGGGDFLIFGGKDAEGELFNDFIRYIPGINAFEPMKKVRGQTPVPRMGATMVTWVNPKTTQHAAQTPQSQALSGAKEVLVCFLLRDREHVFLFGGKGPGGELATGSLYDPGARTWTIVASTKKPPKRAFHISVVFDKVFVHGGQSGESVLDDMWVWDGEEWSEVQYDKDTESMPARCGHSASAWVHKKHKEPCIFFFGGDSTGRGLATNDVWIFSIKTHKWKQVTAYAGNAPPARFGHNSCVFDSNWVIISGGYSGGWISNYVLSGELRIFGCFSEGDQGSWEGGDMYTYDLQANCWFTLEMCGMKSNTCLMHLVLHVPTRTVFSFGAQDTETGTGPVSSDVYRLSPLITYVSFASLRNQVESMNEVINLSFDSQSEGVGRAIRKVDALMKRLETVEREIEGLRTANEYLTKQLEAAQGVEAKGMAIEDDDEEADFVLSGDR